MMGCNMATTALNYNYDRAKSYFGANKEVSFYVEKYLRKKKRRIVKNDPMPESKSRIDQGTSPLAFLEVIPERGGNPLLNSDIDL